jgi:hypothetical protein
MWEESMLMFFGDFFCPTSNDNLSFVCQVFEDKMFVNEIFFSIS